MTGTYGTKRDDFTFSSSDFGDVKDEGPNGPVPTSRPWSSRNCANCPNEWAVTQPGVWRRLRRALFAGAVVEGEP